MNDQISVYKEFLKEILFKRISKDAKVWLEEQMNNYYQKNDNKILYMAFSRASRKTGKELINPSADEIEKADNIRKGLVIQDWTCEIAARIYIILNGPVNDSNEFISSFEKIAGSADVREQIAIYKGLPLFPFPEQLIKRAREGIRTNMKIVFDAVALDNPYPYEYLDMNGWNQMVLKAVFLERPLYKIIGLDERANEELANMLHDFAHERWAAGRDVMPELWRPVAPFINDEILKDLEWIFAEGKEKEKIAVLKACKYANEGQANELVEKYRDQYIKGEEPSWEAIYNDY